VTGGSAVCAQAATHGNPWTSRNHRLTCSQHRPPRTSGRSRFGSSYDAELSELPGENVHHGGDLCGNFVDADRRCV
jgi:hypothetical protein